MSDANLLTCPMYKIEDRKAIVVRVLDALLAGPDCRYDFKGPWKKLTPDEQANWDARQSLVQIKQTFPMAFNDPPSVEVELLNHEATDQPTETES